MNVNEASKKPFFHHTLIRRLAVYLFYPFKDIGLSPPGGSPKRLLTQLRNAP